MRNASAADVANSEGEQSFQNEALPLVPPRRRRGRPRAATTQGQEQQPQVEHEVLEIDLIAFVAGMAGINQGLYALNQAMPLVQQML